MQRPLRIIVNGHPQEVDRPLTVAELLAQLKLPKRGIAVELNAQIVPTARHAEQPLAEGDRLEIVSLVGGG
jgi:thiamine biosynthesis protein ThiS